jgi:hypothetical protein
VNGGLDIAAQLGTVGDLVRAGDQYAEGQPAADDHLFDVEKLDFVPREHLEQGRRDARLITSGDGDQQR